MNTKKPLEEFISNIKECLESKDYEKATKILLDALDVYPNQPSLLINLGNIYKYLGSYGQAENYYKKSLEIENLKEANNNLSVIYLEKNSIDESISFAKKALELDPYYVDAYFNLSLAYEKSGDYENTKEILKKILQIHNDYPNALILLYRIYQNTCDWEKMKSIENKINEITEMGIEHPFMNISRSENIEMNYKVATSWAKKNLIPFRNQPKKQSSQKNKKVRLGYICGEFRNHPTFHLIKNLFKSHDTKKFEVYIFSFNHDEETKIKLKKNKCEFYDITQKSDSESIDIINNCNLDILIDLSVVISNNRINILKSKPAKKIISYLGFPGTSGCKHYDYLLTDKIVTPTDHQPFYTEKLLFLPNCYQINDGKSNFSKTTENRKQHQLPENSIVLASFNQSFKLDSVMFNCWLEILKELDGSVLWLLEDNEIAKKFLHQYVEKNNIDSERLIFAKRIDRKIHLERIKLANVILDTRIYNGHTTTIDALQSGVPVVTKTGNHFASRVSSSLLLSLGLDELCCNNLKDYKQKVIDVCTNKKTMARIFNKLTDKKNYEEIHDNKVFAKKLEKILIKTIV